MISRKAIATSVALHAALLAVLFLGVNFAPKETVITPPASTVVQA